ncbi:indolepyruvate ferredoxin oxidoreductase family protein [Diaphorobacter ruginosibacter]|uniref:Indolepyruvate ferredoxin oxidoreductase family protein n=1 Tax=Diaphorobacter ruginosibacter TaxID=1715720 RepID=A0A7G9RTM7_9BURK|nr:indolepyruvate ferredoxin oxidoreductase family protein [Diaphorobacter ruginosibacter]QNN58952.1 indolepyruvate ferredoxin oxidoreductase family protein [Diaphorobacter ruginosibacter]
MSDLSVTSQLRNVDLEDKYTADEGTAYLTGVQALVRLPMVQKRRDRAAGLNTAGYITGYRGSPLGTFDDQLVKARKHLEKHDITFIPGVNEDLAATAVWGTQQAEIGGDGKFDGVFSIWYGKGPGVDRSGDAFRHGNLAGSSRHGGVLVLMGDDHTCESSTTCHQSEYALMDAQIPILSPAGVPEVVPYGLLGWALSRYSGAWVGMKCIKDTADASGSVCIDDAQLRIAMPDWDGAPEDGLNIRLPDTPHAQEFRLVNYKLDAARAFARANRIDRVAFGSREGARTGIVTSGKSWLDLRQALADLGIDEARARQLGLAVYKVGMVWPLEPIGLREFALGLEQVIVIEEKRGLIEGQIKEILYGEADAPRVIGKRDEQGAKLLRTELALDASMIAQVVGSRLAAADPSLKEVVQQLAQRRPQVASVDVMSRSFYFCAGCPHNTSTRIPDGSRAYAGIGCSWMAQTMGRDTLGYTQMGAEGMAWVGEAPFSRRTHMFQNMGDGTYFHSGLLAVRAAVAAKTNITFKLLYNDAVAMTGGQRHDGPLDPIRMTHQVHAEGVVRIAVVTDEPGKYDGVTGWAPGVTVHHRDELDAVQRTLREIEGTTVLVYDQTCAAEKRRRRKRGTFPDPDKRVVINPEVCEGCGDCGVQSNCVAVVPLETELGRKRSIDQSACNKDFSCIKGFCPSFVTVSGGALRKGASSQGDSDAGLLLPEPVLPDLRQGVYSLVITGVGGTGVVTIGALLGMAAHLEGKGTGVLDMAGLAQKGGSVWTHMRFGTSNDAIAAVRVAPGGADAVVGCDLVVAASANTLAMTRKAATRVLLNSQEVMPGAFVQNPDLQFPANPLVQTVARAVGAENVQVIDAGSLALALCGDSIATNLFMLGAAWQRGMIPVSAEAIERAIELNGAAVKMNIAAFRWGRRHAVHPEDVVNHAFAGKPRGSGKAVSLAPQSLDALVDRRSQMLTEYQNAAYARRYRVLVDEVRAAEARILPGSDALARAVAQGFHKVMAYKDEYEVARLHASPAFAEQLKAQFEDGHRLTFHLAPPGMSRIDQRTGRPAKSEWGGWMMHGFRLLARLKGLRGTAFDVFGRTEERRHERALVDSYEAMIRQMVAGLRADQHALALQIAQAVMKVRGFGPVKEAHRVAYEKEVAMLLERLRHPLPGTQRAAA